jgi:hypothetical protein
LGEVIIPVPEFGAAASTQDYQFSGVAINPLAQVYFAKPVDGRYTNGSVSSPFLIITLCFLIASLASLGA